MNCIKNAPKNTDFSKTTLFVNLEPCSHFGKTPPCADLIIEKGIGRVVVGMIDPNKKVMGEGIKKLKNAGIEVVTGILEDECRNLNKIFIKNQTKGKPYVAIKTATTLDSRIATNTLSSKWITGEKSRLEVQKIRSQFDAIMTGSGTVLIDNPQLNVRDIKGKSPIRIILDRSFKTNFNYNVFKNDGVRVILVTNEEIKDVPKNVEILKFKNFNKLFSDLYKMGICSILIEGGFGLVSQVIKNKEADELYQFIAPKILGCGKNFVEGFEIEDINKSLKTEILEIKKFPPDVLIKSRLLY